MARLPDLPIADWLQDQTERFNESIKGLFPALEFEDGAKSAEEQIPPDYPLLGGSDQWDQASVQTREEELRRQQQEHEDQIRQREEELRQQQQAAEAAQTQQRDDQTMGLAKRLGIPTPGEAAGYFESLLGQSSQNSGATTGILDTREADLGAHEVPPPSPPEPTRYGHFTPTPNIVPLSDAMGASGPLEDVNNTTDRSYVLPGTRNRAVPGEVDEYSFPPMRPKDPEYGPFNPAERNRPVQADAQDSLEIGGPDTEGPYPNQFGPKNGDPIQVSNQESLSPADQFSAWTQQLTNPVFGPPEPDHTSTTGILDRASEAVRGVGSALADTPVVFGHTPREVAAGAEAVGNAADYVIQNFGANKVARDIDRIKELEDEQDQFTGNTSPLQRPDRLDPGWAAANPEKATELEKLRNEQALVVGGMAGAGVGQGAEGIKGVLGINSGKGIVGDAIEAVKAMRAANLGDDLVLAAEQKIAQGSRMTLEEIQALTRGAESAAVKAGGEAATPAEESPSTPVRLSRDLYEELRVTELENLQDVPPERLSPGARKLMDSLASAQPTTRKGQVSSYVIQGDDEALGALHLALDNTVDKLSDSLSMAAADPETRALFRQATAQRDAVQKMLQDRKTAVPVSEAERGAAPTAEGERGLPPDSPIPELGGSPPDPERLLVNSETGERITSLGPIPEGLSEEARAAVRGERAAFEAEQKPLSQADLHALVDEGMGEPGLADRLREAAQNIDPDKVGQQQGMLARRAYEVAGEYGQTLERVQAAARAQKSGSLEDQEMLAHDLANATLEAALKLQEMKEYVQGSSLSARAASRALQALRGPYQAARVLFTADRIKDVAESAGKAAIRVQKAAKNRVIDEGTLRELDGVRAKLVNPRTRKLLTEGEQEAQVGEMEAAAAARRNGGGRGGKGSGGENATKPPAAPTEPPEESLVERLGRLKREQNQLAENGSDAEKSGIAEEIDGIIGQMREAAQARAAQVVENRKGPLTADEADAIVNRAIGQRVQSKISREELAKASGQYERKVSGDLQKSIEDAISRRINDERKLQESIETQMNRRLQTAIDRETNSARRAEVRQMAQDAKVWIKRVRDMPNQPGLREELDLRLRQMADHSNAGEVAARELRQQLESHLGEDAFRYLSGVERRNADTLDRAHVAANRILEDDRIKSVVDRIDTIRRLPHAPGSLDAIEGLYADLTAISQRGFIKQSDMRKRVYNLGLQKAGLDTKNGPLMEQMHQMLSELDPDKPETLRPVLEVLAKPNLWKLIREISFVNLLSRPTTQITNISTSTLSVIGRLTLTNPLSFALSGGHNTGVAAAFRGTKRGFMEGARLAGTTMRTGRNPERVEQQIARGQFGHIEQEVLPQYINKISFGKLGWLGTGMHFVSTRPLEAMDAWIGHIAYSGEMYRAAQQKADDLVRAGGAEVAGKSARQVARDIMANIWDHEDVIAQAGKIADYSLFRGRNVDTPWKNINSGLRQIMSAKEFNPDASFGEKVVGMLVDFILPFFNVPMNFAVQGFNLAIPVVPAIKTINARVKGDRRAFGEQAAKTLIGVGTMGLMAILAAGDNLTDEGPQEDRETWLLTHKINSFRIPGVTTWLTWEGTPIAVPAATMAGAIRGWKEAQKNAEKTPQSWESQLASAGLGATTGVARGAMSQTLLQNVMETFQTLTGQGQTGPSTGAQIAASTALRYTPPVLGPTGLMSFFAAMTDSMERDSGKPRTFDEAVQNTLDRYKTNIPGLRETVPERLDMYGQPVRNTRAGLNSIKPFYRGPAPYEGDRTTEILQQAGVGVPQVPPAISIAGGKIDMTPNERRMYQQEYGQNFRRLLDAYKTTSQPVVTDAQLEKIRTQAHDMAQARVLASIGREAASKRWKYEAPVEVPLR